MAGTFQDNSSKNPPDILFDLTPEDDALLQESDLTQLVNYGQVIKPVSVFGTDGRKYEITFALLWDEDYIDILRRTVQYANDSLLRVRILRKLKLFKAIQSIDKNDYSNKQDPVKQRQLWTVLSRVSDRQMENLDTFYTKIELERDVLVLTAMKQFFAELDKTAPKELQPKKENKEEGGIEHEAYIESMKGQQEKAADATATVIKEAFQVTDGEVEGKTKSPKQNPKGDVA
jgi:hypothetical protein